MQGVGRLALLVGLVATASAPGQERPGKSLDPAATLGALTGADSKAALAGQLRAFLLAHLPEPLFEDKRKWDRMARGPRGVMRKDGRWWKVRASALHPRETLLVDIRDIQKVAPGTNLFTVFVSFDARVVLDRQTWKLDTRLYSGSTRARLRVKMMLVCEVSARTEPTKWFLPDAVFRLRVVKSDLKYDNLVVEHTAGMGGDIARVLGRVVVGGIHEFRPELEGELLAKANAAIVKAADTRDVRISLGSLFGGKK